MPLFLKHNKSVLYIHVPKTGGTSIEQLFAANGFRSEFLDAGSKGNFNRLRICSPQHMHAELLLSLIRPARVDYVFMTVRNPLSRILSEYRMRVRHAGETLTLGQWLQQSMRRYLEDPFINDNHLRPQTEFWIRGCDVLRQEDGFGDAFIARIEERLGMTLDDRRIGSLNTDAGTTLEPSEIRQVEPMVREFYHEDYRRFGY